MISVDFKELQEFQEKLEELEDDREQFLRNCSKELALRLLRKAVKRTPVGIYPASTGKSGGTLIGGWTAGSDLRVHKSGSNYIVEIKNPTEYASYVEYGHRTRSGGWVKGKFMLTISEQELQNVSVKILEKKLEKWLGGVF